MKKHFLTFVFLITFIGPIQSIFSHGTVIWPPSRIYSCYNNPSLEVCKPCGNSIYNWMGVLQPDTDYGKHQDYIRDGEIASGGNGSAVDFSCLDVLSTDWPTTNVDHGYVDVEWKNTAPHKTQYYKVYITPLDWNPNKPLKWNELIEIGHKGKGAAESITIIKSFIPDSYAGKRAALVSIWQRDYNDSHEAFYSVSDILVSGGDVDNEDEDNEDEGNEDDDDQNEDDDNDSSNCNTISSWNSNEVYWKGDNVKYLDNLYVAKWWTRGDNPSNNSGTYEVWKDLGICDVIDRVNIEVFSLTKIIYNSSSRLATVHYKVNSPKKMTMTIRNLSNNKLLQVFGNQYRAVGEYHQVFDFKSLNPGIYLCVLEDRNGVLKSIKIGVK